MKSSSALASLALTALALTIVPAVTAEWHHDKQESEKQYVFSLLSLLFTAESDLLLLKSNVTEADRIRRARKS